MTPVALPLALAGQLRDSRWRVLVTGASGWLGRTALELLVHSFGSGWHGRVEAFGSSARRLTLRDGTEIQQSALSELNALPPQPSLLLHFAYLTREKVAGTSLDDYIETNRAITRTVLEGGLRAGVERALVTSSGAVHAALAVPASPDPTLLYGQLKLEDEALFESFAQVEPGRSALAVRLFNLSGPYINKPYALASFIEQARSGRISVQARRPVTRSYTSAANLLGVGLGHLLNDEAEPFLCIETAGECEVEMAALAEAVRAVVNPSAVIDRAAPDGSPADRYVGDGRTYRALMQRYGVAEDLLPRQIGDTADYLRDFPSALAMDQSDTLTLRAAETPANVALICRVCGSAEVAALPIGVYAPFFQLRVDVRRDRFALWTCAGRIEAPPDVRRAGGTIRRIARGLKRRLHRRLASAEATPRLLRTMCHWCAHCRVLTPAHEFSFDELLPLYADYRSASYNRDRVSVEASYAALAARVGADPRERESRNTGVARFVLPHLPATPRSGARALDLGGSDGRFIPPELISRHSPTHIVDTSAAAIEPSLAARGVQKVAAPDAGGYDLVMCMHVLEHVGHPRHFVMDAMKHLLPGGLLYLEIPLELDPQTPAQFAARTVDRTVTFHEHINQFDTGSMAQLVASIEGLELLATEAAEIDCGWTTGRVARTLARRVR